MKKVLFVILALFFSASASLSAQSTGMTIRAGYSPYTLKSDSSINAGGVMAVSQPETTSPQAFPFTLITAWTCTMLGRRGM